METLKFDGVPFWLDRKLGSEIPGWFCQILPFDGTNILPTPLPNFASYDSRFERHTVDCTQERYVSAPANVWIITEKARPYLSAFVISLHHIQFTWRILKEKDILNQFFGEPIVSSEKNEILPFSFNLNEVVVCNNPCSANLCWRGSFSFQYFYDRPLYFQRHFTTNVSIIVIIMQNERGKYFCDATLTMFWKQSKAR
jgi:hypothetical protein